MALSSEKDIYNIRKFDGTNFSIWKKQIQDVLTQKNQLVPLSERQENDGMSEVEWKQLDAEAKSTIRLHRTESVYFTIVGEATTQSLWQKLCDTYEKKTASNKVYLMKKLYELRMKEGGSVSAHLNDFNILFAQLTSQGLMFDGEVQSIFLKSLEPTKSGDAYIAHSQKQRGRTHDRDKSKEHRNTRSKSRDSMRNIECHYCHKKGHMKKDCHALKRDNKKTSNDDNKFGTLDAKGKEKVEEINVVESHMVGQDDGANDDDAHVSDILIFTSDLCADALITHEANYA